MGYLPFLVILACFRRESSHTGFRRRAGPDSRRKHARMTFGVTCRDRRMGGDPPWSRLLGTAF
jgi:hypothetical protein